MQETIVRAEHILRYWSSNLSDILNNVLATPTLHTHSLEQDCNIDTYPNFMEKWEKQSVYMYVARFSK